MRRRSIPAAVQDRHAEIGQLLQLGLKCALGPDDPVVLVEVAQQLGLVAQHLEEGRHPARALLDGVVDPLYDGRGLLLLARLDSHVYLLRRRRPDGLPGCPTPRAARPSRRSAPATMCTTAPRAGSVRTCHMIAPVV